MFLVDETFLQKGLYRLICSLAGEVSVIFVKIIYFQLEFWAPVSPGIGRPGKICDSYSSRYYNNNNNNQVC